MTEPALSEDERLGDAANPQVLVSVLGTKVATEPSNELVDIDGGLWTCQTPVHDEDSHEVPDAETRTAPGFGELTQLLGELQGEHPRLEEHQVELDGASDSTQSLTDDEQELARLIAELEVAPGDDLCPAALQLEQSPLFQTKAWQDKDVGPASSKTCSICLADFEACQQVTTIVRCQHVYHLSCLRQWMEAPPFSCPMCRADAVALDSAAELSAESGAAKRHGWQPLPKQPLKPPAASGVRQAAQAGRILVPPSRASGAPHDAKPCSALILGGPSGHVLPSHAVARGYVGLAPRKHHKSLAGPRQPKAAAVVAKPGAARIGQ